MGKNISVFLVSAKRVSEAKSRVGEGLRILLRVSPSIQAELINKGIFPYAH
jgi:hypothetical protein